MFNTFEVVLANSMPWSERQKPLSDNHTNNIITQRMAVKRLWNCMTHVYMHTHTYIHVIIFLLDYLNVSFTHVWAMEERETGRKSQRHYHRRCCVCLPQWLRWLFLIFSIFFLLFLRKYSCHCVSCSHSRREREKMFEFNGSKSLSKMWGERKFITYEL